MRQHLAKKMIDAFHHCLKSLKYRYLVIASCCVRGYAIDL